MLNLLGSIYQFEREILLERQRVGIEKAKRDGKFKGRVPTAKNKSVEIIELTNQSMKPCEIAKKLDIGVASLYRHRLKV